MKGAVRAVSAMAAAVLFAGQPPAGIRVECACPISVRGGAALSYKAQGGSARMFTKGGWQRIVVDGPAESLAVSIPPIHAGVVVRAMGDIDVREIKGSVHAEAIGGRVLLDGIEGDAVARTDGGEIKAGRVGGSLRAISGGNGISVGHVDGEAWCETAGGEIIVERAGGPLHASTGGGNIYVAEAVMSVTARSDGGLIDIVRSGGVVVAQTRGGSIQVGASKGVRCESAAGAIRVRNTGGDLRAQTAIGSILAEFLPGTRLEGSSLRTGAGDITVMIPSNLMVSVQAVNESRGRLARIVSDFPEIRITGVQVWPMRSAAAAGVLNGGGPVLQISAAGGTIHLRRQ
jgi:hypothetical protein